MSPQDFIDAIGPAARDSYQSSGVWASVTIAQGALESGWGSSQLAAQGKNLFGIKADPSWVGDTLSLPTFEFINGIKTPMQALWRSYGDWKSAIDDHAAFLKANPRYAVAMLCRDAESFVSAIASAGYSTDPDYSTKVISIMRYHNLSQFDVVGT